MSYYNKGSSYGHKKTGNHQFSTVPRATIERSTFDRSHYVKTSFDEAYLIPIYVDEILPGDTFKLSMNAFCRMTTPIKPVMDNIYMDSFFFFVPNRLVWENWQKFCGEQVNPGDSTDFINPYINIPYASANGTGNWADIFDYMGIPPQIYPADIEQSIKFNALPFRAVNLIYNDWFRDENLIDSVTVPVDDGPDGVDIYKLLKRGKRHDYFTSCLPWPQKGPEVTIPGLSGTVGVSGIGASNNAGTGTFSSVNAWEFNEQEQVYPLAFGSSGIGTGPNPDFYVRAHSNEVDYDTDVYVDLSTAVAMSINALRQAFQLQKLYERDARGGTRYTEIVRQHFGVVSPDARLQRPEYLGGGSSRINIHPLGQTSASPTTPTTTDAQGNLAAFATGAIQGHGFVKSFTEHGIIVGFVSVRADMTYQQGLNRMWSRSTRFDYYWPALSHIGEQEVLNQEILLTSYIHTFNAEGNEDVFGYQERYAEYRYKPSMITGQMRSGSGNDLDVWHLAQFFTTMPTLSKDFIEENPPIPRISAVETSPHFYFDAFIDLKCTRPMPVYGVPGLIDHF